MAGSRPNTEQERLVRNIRRDMAKLRRKASPEMIVDQYMQYGWGREFLAAHVREIPGDIAFLQQLMSEMEQELERRGSKN